jgi:putative transposase
MSIVKSKIITKAYKVRVSPTKIQIEQIEKTFNQSRFVYNFFLAQNKERMELGEYKLNYSRESEILTFLKNHQEYQWLKESDKFSLQNSIKDQDRAFKNFFEKRAGFPKFHSKRSSYQSYRTNYTNGNIEIKDNRLKLPKLKWIKFYKSQEIRGKIVNVTILRENNLYYASITVNTEIKPKSKAFRRIGIDLGLTSLCYTKNDIAEVEDIKNPKWLEKSLRKVQKISKQLSRKQHSRKNGDTTPKSKNYNKQSKKLAKIHQKVTNQRKDFLHKLSTRIINENQVIGIEDLNVSGMLKNSKLSRHISQSGWRMFRNMLEYKADWYSRELVVHNRFFASSKTCSCGVKNKTLSLSQRLWQCQSCGEVHQRDELAAQNLIPEGHGE